MFARCIAIGSVVSVLFIVAGILGIVLVPPMVKVGIRSMREITSKSSPLFDTWQNNSDNNQYMSVYFYNLTNAEDVVRGAVPKFVTVGPYTYHEIQVKPVDSIEWLVNGTVQYTYNSTYQFQPALSINRADGRQLKESDEMTNNNLAVFGVMADPDISKNPILLNSLLALLDNATQAQGYFMTHSVAEWLWGWQEPLLFNKVIGLLNTPSPSAALPSAMYTGANGHKEGMSDSDSLGVYTMWAGQTKLDLWGDDYANMINGTDGTMFKSDISNGDILTCFVDQVQRSANLRYLDEHTIHGVTTKRFVLDDSSLAKSVAFQMPERGFIPIPGAPAYMSLPYYTHADLKNVNISMDGHNPPVCAGDSTDCEVVISIEPMSGIVFQAHKRLQMNLQSGPVQYNVTDGNGTKTVTMLMTQNFSPTWWPIMYVDENGAASSSTCSDFSKMVYMPLRLGKYGGISLLVAAVLILIAMPVYVLRKKKQMQDDDYIEHEPLVNRGAC